jgi:DNA-binding NarL/FixJ family response regulator
LLPLKNYDSAKFDPSGGREMLQDRASASEVRPAVVNLHGSYAQAGKQATAASILLCDPRPLTRQCLAQGLAGCWPEADVLPVAGLQELADTVEPRVFDLVLLNLGPASATDPEVAQEIEGLRSCLEAPLALLSDVDDLRAVAGALRCGARAYISTTSDLAVVVSILHLVCAGGTYVPASLIEQAPVMATDPTASAIRTALNPICETFTPKELEIMGRLKDGKPNKIIAYELDICESTVKVHMRHIMGKLSATNRTQAALLAQQILVDRL